MHRTNVARVLRATKCEFQKARFVSVQPFVTTLGCARVGAQVHGSDMMIADNDADVSLWIDSEIAEAILLIHRAVIGARCVRLENNHIQAKDRARAMSCAAVEAQRRIHRVARSC